VYNNELLYVSLLLRPVAFSVLVKALALACTAGCFTRGVETAASTVVV
jgi:hypothetical protein